MNVLHFIAQNRTEVLELTGEHLWLVGASIALALRIVGEIADGVDAVRPLRECDLVAIAKAQRTQSLDHMLKR